MTRAVGTAVGRHTPNTWRVLAIAAIVALIGVACSASVGDTVISSDTATATPTAVPAAQQPTPTEPAATEPTATEPTTEVATAVPEPTLAIPAATEVPTVDPPERFVDGETTLSFGEVTTVDVTAADSVGQTSFRADEGEWIDITVVPLDELDVVVDVRDANGVSLLVGGPVDSSFDTERIRVLEMPAAGIYSVVVSGYQGTSGSAEVLVERSLQDSGTLLQGTESIDDSDDTQDFPFSARAGDIVRLVVDPASNDHDVVLSVIYAESGEVLDDVDASTGLEELVIEAPDDGDYYFRVASFDGSTGSYDFIMLAPATTVLVLTSNDVVVGRIGSASALQYRYQPYSSGTFTIAMDALDGVDVTLSIFDSDQERIVEGEDTGDGGTLLAYEVAADVVYLIEVASPGAGGSFELGVILE